MDFISNFGFNDKITSLASKAYEDCKPAFERIEETARYNNQKVLAAFIKNRISETHFNTTTGYGYDDKGRDAADALYKDIFGAEAAIVRHFMLSGTHALTVMLFGILRPGDTMLSVAGKPYDTLDSVIGLNDSKNGNLKEFGVKYEQVDLKDGRLDYEAIEQALLTKPKMAYLQRSRGYDTRPTITIAEIEKVAEIIKRVSPDTVFAIDNCYGEFTEKKEPTEVGADIMAGSLIKNPGGAMAQSGGYIAGREDLVELCSYRLTSPGLGGEIGASLGQNVNIIKGIYFAPTIVENALKTAVFTAAIYQRLGFDCSPTVDEYRSDIVQQIRFGTAQGLISFCQGIQACSPIDSYVAPEPWAMPGYNDEVIMAAGAFVGGSSIELSADGPLREPYAAFMQGGIIFDSACVAIVNTVKKLVEDGVISL